MAKIHPQIAACFLPSCALNGIQTLVFGMKAKQPNNIILFCTLVSLRYKEP